MMKPLYTLESESATKLEHLGYTAAVHDLVVQAAHTELNRFLRDEGEAVHMWGWAPGSLHDADRYRVSQLLRSFTYQEQVMVDALKRLDETYRAYIDASPENRKKAEEFIDSLNQAAARRAVDYTVSQLRLPEGVGAWLTADKRDLVAKALVAKWQKPPAHGGHTYVSMADDEIQAKEGGLYPGEREEIWERARQEGQKEAMAMGPQLVADAIADQLKGVPGLAQLTKTFAQELAAAQPGEHSRMERYVAPPFRRVYTAHSVVDFHDPEIARELGSRGYSYYSFSRKDRTVDTSFKGSGFDMVLWRLKDHGYPTERIPDGLLYNLVDTALAVQAEYQLQCFFVDRELAKVIATRGEEEQWLYKKTAEWAAERAAAKQAEIDRWGFWGDVLGMVSAVAGVLAFIPGLSVIAGPVAILTAAVSLGLHAKAISLKDKVETADGITIAADVISAIPFVGTVSKGAKGAWAAARMNKVANVVVSNSGRAFVGAIASKSASDASRVFDYLGKKGAKAVTGTATQSKIPGKVLEGAFALATQVPTAVDWATPVDQSAKDTAARTVLSASIGQTVGEWNTVGVFTKKAGTVSLERFSNFFKKIKV
ncbi:hypothetical protein ACX6XY_12195 [Streptomyces sp. O3]